MIFFSKKKNKQIILKDLKALKKNGKKANYIITKLVICFEQSNKKKA